jgi:solute carrier family 25 carnitine/acylcarnitine transporter 20/29
MGVAMVNAFLFGVYGSFISYQLTNPTDEPTIKQIFIAGCGSGFVNSLISCPTELAKIQLQNQVNGAQNDGGKRLYTGTIDCLRKIYRVHGIKGIFRGMGATVVRETPSYGAYFSSYELLCRLMLREKETLRDPCRP